jgi:hypothetical protein
MKRNFERVRKLPLKKTSFDQPPNRCSFSRHYPYPERHCFTKEVHISQDQGVSSHNITGDLMNQLPVHIIANRNGRKPNQSGNRREPQQRLKMGGILDLLYFLGLNDRVVLPDLLRPVGSVVERAVVLVTVAVHCAEEAAASASKA